MRTVIGLVLLTAALAAAADSSVPFSVGVLRRDGVVIPSATYDGKRWSPHWPPADREPEIPINLRSVPPRWWGAAGLRDVWHTWIGNRTGATIRVLQPDVVDAHCVRQVGLRTDYRSSQPPAPRDEQPYPKDGLVVSPPQTIEPIEIIDAHAPQLAGLKTPLHEAFDRAERVTAEHFRHPVNPKIREQIAPEIEAVYAFGQAPRVYYVESQRAYSPVDTQGDWPFEDSKGCGIAFGSGWFARDETGFHSLEMSVRMVPCDKYGANYMLPFGGMHLGSRVYWIVQFSGWEHERYVVVDVGSKAVEAVVNAWGGGC